MRRKLWIWDDVSAVTSDLALPQSGAFGTSIVWLSDKPLVISNTGAVTRSESDVHVTLTAIVTGCSPVKPASGKNLW